MNTNNKLKYIEFKRRIIRFISNWDWKTNFNEIELEITSFCSLGCYNCNRSIRQAPSNETMSLSQVKIFVSESIDLGKKWNKIVLIGGEPTLHPQIFEIIEVLNQYQGYHPDCSVQIATNGYGLKVNEVVSRLPGWIFLRNSRKRSIEHDFCSYNIAPADVDYCEKADYSKGCWITNFCGLGLTRNGYYVCGPGGSVDRIFGFDIGLKKLIDVNKESLKNQRLLLCKYCGHYKTNYNSELVDREIMSESWRKAYNNYNNKKPNMTLYGE